MDDLRDHDRKLFWREFLSPGRSIGFGAAIVATLAIALPEAMTSAVVIGSMLTAWWVSQAHAESVKKRFWSPRIASLWRECEQRLKLFDQVLKKMKHENVGDLLEMPRTVHQVGQTVYTSLRKADMIAHDVHTTEAELQTRPPAWTHATSDSQTQELLQVADQNRAEYRRHYQNVMAGVQRAEAQAAVFMTTVDSLRMKMIGYRFVGRAPELSQSEFLGALREAKLQLQAIDTALDELDFENPFGVPTPTASGPHTEDEDHVRLGQPPPPPPELR